MGEIRMTRDFFLWLLSVIYLFAFVSLYVQIPGLYGDNGILPAKLVLQKGSAESAFDFADLLTNQPTLLRLLPRLGLDTQASMDFLCLGGVILSFVAMVSRNQRNSIVFGVLWMMYFSLFQVGQTFLWFQWDIFLLETGFLAVLVAPLNLFGWRSTLHNQHDHITFWLVKWLLFRLMFASGVVKLTSNCPTWWGLTALNYHYETQCIPTALAWYAQQLPAWFQKLSVVGVYVIEIAVPFLYFSPVRAQRIFAFYAQVFLMTVILLTGNYNFFNLLTIALSVCLVDDNFIRKWLGQKPRGEIEEPKSFPLIGTFWRPIKWALNILVFGGMIFWTIKLFNLKVVTKPFQVTSSVAFKSKDLDRFLQNALPLSIWIGVISLGWHIIKASLRSLLSERGILRKAFSLLGCLVFGIAAFWMFAVSLVPHTSIHRASSNALPGQVHQWHGHAKTYRLTSSYGLFRRMTGVGGRPEVVIEGSNEINSGWQEYHFLHKPGNVTEPLHFVAPHQPRLDWQMWFAALGSYEHNPWFLNLVYRLLENQPEVLELMGKNPYPKKPPRYIRATLYHYHFTSMDEASDRYSDDDWWVRTKVSEYLPILSKKEPSFINYLKNAKIYKGNPGEKKIDPNPFLLGMIYVRRYVGQWDGLTCCVSLFITGLVLAFLDPALRLLKNPYQR